VAKKWRRKIFGLHGLYQSSKYKDHEDETTTTNNDAAYQETTLYLSILTVATASTILWSRRNCHRITIIVIVAITKKRSRHYQWSLEPPRGTTSLLPKSIHICHTVPLACGITPPHTTNTQKTIARL